jgi:hypothetical protein
MAAPIGNTNAAKGRMFYDKLRKCLVQHPERLDRIVDQLVTQAELGESWAVKEIIDRLDGKAVQVLENGDGSPLLSGINVTFVRPADE